MDFLAKSLLLGADVKVLLVILVFGIWCFKNDLKDHFYRAFFILLLTMILASFLKSIFKIPSEFIVTGSSGWTFPSSHMQVATCFWIYLSWKINSRIFHFLSIFVLVGIGSALVYFNYHLPQDIIGALFFGTLTVIVYLLISEINFFSNVPRFGFIIAFIFLPITWFLYTRFNFRHVILANAFLFAIPVGYFLFEKFFSHVLLTSLDRLFISFFAVAIGCLVYKFVPIPNLYVYIPKFIFIGLWLSFFAPAIYILTKASLVKI